MRPTKQAKFTIKTGTWVNLVLAGFVAWMIIITVVVWFAAKASYIESQKPVDRQCRGEFGHKRPPEFCE